MTALEALESYSSFHPESVNDLLEWPYRRFMKAFSSWQKRKAVEELDTKMNLHVAALYANTNLDDKENNRGEYIKSVENYYDLLKDLIWKDPKETQMQEKEAEEMEANDPFLAAGKRNLAKLNPMQIKFKSTEI